MHWPLTPIVSLALFMKWGIDFIGPISSPVSSRRNRYVYYPGTDYATKWVEAWATRRNDAETAAAFMFEQILIPIFMRFGMPLEVVSDKRALFPE